MRRPRERGRRSCFESLHGPGGETGRREGLKIPFPQGSPSSSLGPGICRFASRCETLIMRILQRHGSAAFLSVGLAIARWWREHVGSHSAERDTAHFILHRH